MNNSSSCDYLITLLSKGISNRKLYFADHPRVQSTCKLIIEALAQLLAKSCKSSLLLGVSEGKLVHEDHFLPGPSIIGGRLIELAGLLRCGGFTFSQTASQADISEFISLAATMRKPVETYADAQALLTAKNIRNIDIPPPYSDSGWFVQLEMNDGREKDRRFSQNGDSQSMLLAQDSLFNTLGETFDQIQTKGHFDLKRIRQEATKLLTATSSDFMDIMQMVSYPSAESYSIGHSIRVAMIASLVGHNMGLADEDVIELNTAGLLHDVGKARIPSEILNKTDRLTPAERNIMEGHPRLGAEILIGNRYASPIIITGAWGHHIRHDGGGYPKVNNASTVGKATALLHLCDVFEALTAPRPFKDPLTPPQALDIIINQDPTSFDPATVKAFINAMGFYPPGTSVALNSGAVGIVVSAGTDPARPCIKLLENQTNTPASQTEEILDLGDVNNIHLAIDRVIPLEVLEPTTV